MSTRVITVQIDDPDDPIVDGRRTVTVVGSASLGPQGIPGNAAAAAAGEVTDANDVWLMIHNLGISEQLFNPALWWFEDHTGVAMEPAVISWLDEDKATAQWLEAVRGTWKIN